MRPRVFLDTNVFIYAYEFPQSNSRKIVDLLNRAEMEVIISERVLQEVQRYFRKYYGKDLAGAFRHYLLLSCTVIPSSQLQKAMTRYKGRIKEKDLEQLAVVKKLGLRFLIAYDRDFEPFEEYVIPKKFLESLNLETTEEEF